MRGGIGRVKHGLQLILQQIGNEPLIRPLERDRQYAADLLERRRLPILGYGNSMKARFRFAVAVGNA